MRRRVLLAILASALAGGVLSGQAKTTPRSVERAFNPAGHVWMELSAGDYRIRPGRADRVWVEWTTPDPDDINRCKATIETKGRDLLVVTNGPHGGMKVVVEVPAQSDLTVRLSAGDLTVEGVRGSKDISSWAGDMTIEVGPREDYRSVQASVTAGDLSARPFDVTKGGLFRSFSWQGQGKYSLTARLTAGDLTLR